MRSSNRKTDIFLLAFLVGMLVALPVGIFTYNHHLTAEKARGAAKVFTLTGNAERGWIIGDVAAYKALALWEEHGQPMGRPVIEVNRGDRVVLKLTSSDVVHGFSLKDFGVFLTQGIQPGKVVFVSFKANRPGTFTFSCNAVCGPGHENMKGILVVKA